MNQFYVLHFPDPTYVDGVPDYGETDWGRIFKPIETLNGFESVKCPIDSGHQRVGRRIGRLEIILRQRIRSDFLWTWFSDCLVGPRVVDLLEKTGATGYRLEPVKIVRARYDEDLGAKLFELVPTGTPVPMDPRSGVRLTYRCEACGIEYYSPFSNGLQLNVSKWGGEDVFVPKEYWKYIEVTERLKDAISAEGLTNCMLVKTENFHWPETVPPAGLSEYLERLRQSKEGPGSPT
jgi:hypothetical protein